MRRFLTITEVTEILNVTPNQVRVLINSGELAAIQVGGRGQWRIEDVKLDEYIDAMYAAQNARTAGNAIRKDSALAGE